MSTLAKKAGISVPYLSLIESGKRQPSLAVLRRLGAVLRVPSEVILLLSQAGNGTLRSTDKRAEKMVAAIQKLQEAERLLRKTLELGQGVRDTR